MKLLRYVALLVSLFLMTGFTKQDWELINTYYEVKEYVSITYPVLEGIPVKFSYFGTSYYSEKEGLRLNYNEIRVNPLLQLAINHSAVANGFNPLIEDVDFLRFLVLHEYGHAYGNVHDENTYDFVLDVLGTLRILCPLIHVSVDWYRNRPNEHYADMFAFENIEKLETFYTTGE